MSETIVTPYTGAAFISVGGQCYELLEITEDSIATVLAVDGEFESCAECQQALSPQDLEIPKYPGE